MRWLACETTPYLTFVVYNFWSIEKFGLYFLVAPYFVLAENDLAVIGQQFPFEPLEYQRENLRLPFAEGIKMLQEAGFEVASDLLNDCFLASASVHTGSCKTP